MLILAVDMCIAITLYPVLEILSQALPPMCYITVHVTRSLSLPCMFLHTANGQKLGLEKAWKQG